MVGVEVTYSDLFEARWFLKNLAPFQRSLDRSPDIQIRFFDPEDVTDLRFVGQDEVGFRGDDFYLLDERNGSAVASIPFDEIGGPIQLRYPPGCDSAPLFDDIVRLTFLNKGFVPVHGSGFRFQGTGVLAAGWAKGGKTRTLLAFAKHGAQYVADDWVILDGKGSRMYGLPVKVTLWTWQFDQIPELLPEIKIRRRTLFAAVRLAQKMYEGVTSARITQRFRFGAIGKLMALARRQLKITRSPESIFGVVDYSPQPVHIAFLVISHSKDALTVEPIEKPEFVERILNSNTAEWAGLLRYYEAFKFAYPDRRNPLLDDLEARQRSVLEKSLAEVPAYVVMSPYPANLEDLFNSLTGLVATASQRPIGTEVQA